MRTLAELEVFVRDTFAQVSAEAPLIKVRIGDESIGMAIIDYGAQPCLLVMLDVCAEDALSPSRVLELNRDIGPASLVPVGGRYLLRQVMPLHDATAPFIRWTCSYVTDQARRVRAGLMRVARDGACYAHYLD